MPDLVMAGRMSPSDWRAFSWIPNDFGIDAPVISASNIATLFPSFAAWTARLEDTKLFPTPPFPLKTPITF